MGEHKFYYISTNSYNLTWTPATLVEKVVLDCLYGDALTPGADRRFSLMNAEQMLVKSDVPWMELEYDGGLTAIQTGYKL